MQMTLCKPDTTATIHTNREQLMIARRAVTCECAAVVGCHTTAQQGMCTVHPGVAALNILRMHSSLAAFVP